MKYKADKYTYRIEWSEEDRAHVARCLEFPSLAAHGKTSEDALREIKEKGTQKGMLDKMQTREELYRLLKYSGS